MTVFNAIEQKWIKNFENSFQIFTESGSKQINKNAIQILLHGEQENVNNDIPKNFISFYSKELRRDSAEKNYYSNNCLIQRKESLKRMYSFLFFIGIDISGSVKQTVSV